MAIVVSIHRMLGMMILPVVLLLGALYLAFARNAHPAVGRAMAVLVDIQVAIGLAWFVFGLATGRTYGPMSWVHLLVGLLAAGLGHMAAKNVGPLARLGSKGPAVGFVVVLILVLLTIPLGLQA